MGRFEYPDEWVVSCARMSGKPGFTAVIYRRDDASAIWRWMCPHLDHLTPEEAMACAERKLGGGVEPVETAARPSH